MALRRVGWPDEYLKARLLWLSDSRPYLKPPGSLRLVLLRTVPTSDGSDAIVDPSDAPSTAVTPCSPRQDPSSGGHAHTWYVQPMHDPSWAIPGNPDIEGHHTYQAWAIADGATGEVLYVGIKSTMAAFGKVLSLPAASFKVFAEHPTA